MGGIQRLQRTIYKNGLIVFVVLLHSIYYTNMDAKRTNSMLSVYSLTPARVYIVHIYTDRVGVRIMAVFFFLR